VKNSVFFCKDIFDDILKTLPSNEMKDILNQSNFLEINILSSLRLVLLSPSASRLTLYASRFTRFTLFGSVSSGLGN